MSDSHITVPFNCAGMLDQKTERGHSCLSHATKIVKLNDLEIPLCESCAVLFADNSKRLTINLFAHVEGQRLMMKRALDNLLKRGSV